MAKRLLHCAADFCHFLRAKKVVCLLFAVLLFWRRSLSRPPANFICYRLMEFAALKYWPERREVIWRQNF
jgi:hypothetical protein